MKSVLIIFIVSVIGSCSSIQYTEEFNCYADAINSLFKDHHVDTVYVASNVSNFKVAEGKLPEQIFYYHDLNENQSKYSEIFPNSSFWDHNLLNQIKTHVNKRNNTEVHFTRFNYNAQIKWEKYPNFNRTYLTFSPIYYNNIDNNGFFIVAEINNLNIGFTSIFYIKKNHNSYEIFDHIKIHRIMPN